MFAGLLPVRTTMFEQKKEINDSCSRRIWTQLIPFKLVLSKIYPISVQCQSGLGCRVDEFFNHWKNGKKRKEHFLLLTFGKFRYRPLGRRNISWQTKVFLVLYNSFLIFYSFCQSGDRTFTITATKTVCNWVKNKSQIQRDEIPTEMQNHWLVSNGKMKTSALRKKDF